MDAENVSDIYNTNLFIRGHGEFSTKLGIMAAKIAYYNFQWRYVALVIYLTAQHSLTVVDTFLSHYNQSVVVKLGKFRLVRRVTIPQYVLFGKESSEISEYLRWLIDSKHDNTGNFIIICNSRDYKECNEAHIFKTLAEIYIVNAIFLRINNAGHDPVAFTYSMVMPDKCKNHQPQRLLIKNDCVNDTCFKLLYRENFSDLYKCPLVVSTFEQPPFMYLHNGTSEPTGGDGYMLQVVTNALNATLEIKTPTDGSDWGHYENNNWTGSMGDIFNGRAHLSMCSLPLTSYKYGNFQISFVYNTMDIVWVAQLPALKPPWVKLLYPFNYRARVGVFLMFICIMLVSGLLRTTTWRELRKSFNIGYPKQSVLFYSWIIFLGMPILKMPSKRGLLIIVYSWIWFCFVVRSCYQAALISSLKERKYESNIKSFKEILEKKYTYGGQATYREYFVNEKKIYDNWKQLTFDEAYIMLHKISNGTSNFVLAYNKELVIEHLLNHNGTRRLQIVPQKILISPTVMYFKKYSPLIAPLNTLLSRAVESGFAQLWHMRYGRRRKYLFQHSKHHGPESLTLEHFAGCILVIIFGWLLSILFFIIEIFCGRVEKT